MQRKYEATLILPAALSTGRLHFQIAKQHTKEKTDHQNPWSYEHGGRKKWRNKKISLYPISSFWPQIP